MLILIKSSSGDFRFSLGTPFTSAQLKQSICGYLGTSPDNILVFDNGKVIDNDAVYDDNHSTSPREFTVKMVMIFHSNYQMIKSAVKSEQKTGYGPRSNDDPPFFEEQLNFLVNLGFARKYSKAALRNTDFSLTNAIAALSKGRRSNIDSIVIGDEIEYAKSDDNAKWSDRENILLFKKKVEYGSRWTVISSYFPDKTLLQIKAHWYHFFWKKINTIKTNITPKEVWTNEETDLLFFCYFALNKNFDRIKQFFPSKTKEELSVYCEEILLPSMILQGRMTKFDEENEGDEEDEKVKEDPRVWSEDDDKLLRLTIERNGNDPSILKLLLPKKKDTEIQARLLQLFGKDLPAPKKQEQPPPQQQQQQQSSSSAATTTIQTRTQGIRTRSSTQSSNATNEKKEQDDFEEVVLKQRTKTIKWSEEDNYLLLDLYEKYPNNWDKLASHFQGRTPNAVSQHYSIIKRKNYERRESRSSAAQEQEKESVKETPKQEPKPKPQAPAESLEIKNVNPFTPPQDTQIPKTPEKQDVAKTETTTQNTGITVKNTETTTQKTEITLQKNEDSKPKPAVVAPGQVAPISIISLKSKINQAERDEKIKKFACSCGFKWPMVAAAIPEMSERAIRERWNALKKAHNIAFPTTLTGEENELLVEKYGALKGNWEEIVKFFPGKSIDTLIFKYDDIIRPRPEKYTPEEDALLERLVNEYGKLWTKIAPYFPNRNTRSLKKHYDVLLLKKETDEKAAHVTPQNEAKPVQSQLNMKIQIPKVSTTQQPTQKQQNTSKAKTSNKLQAVLNLDSTARSKIYSSNTISIDLTNVQPTGVLLSSNSISQSQPLQSTVKIDLTSLPSKSQPIVEQPKESSDPKKLLNPNWNGDDINYLMKLVEKFGYAWDKIEVYFPTKNSQLIKKEWDELTKYDPNHNEKYPWTDEEMAELKSLITKYGKMRWISISAPFIETKSPEEIVRKIVAIDEEESWNGEKDSLLVSKYAEESGNWDNIQKFFPEKSKELLQARWARLKLGVHE